MEKYYLPAFMTLTADIKLDIQVYGEGDAQHIEITNDDQDSIFQCLFVYWCSITNFINLNRNIKDNYFYGLTTKQTELVEIWLQGIDFITWNKAGIFPEGFDFSNEGLANFITKMKKHSV